MLGERCGVSGWSVIQPPDPNRATDPWPGPLLLRSAGDARGSCSAIFQVAGCDGRVVSARC